MERISGGGGGLNFSSLTGFSAFTLAEVLITLAIIGVVAAMTMPVIVASYKKQVTVTRLKKFYSFMSQAALMAQNEYGENQYWDYPATNDQEGVKEFFLKYFGPYVKYTDIRKDLPSYDACYTVYFPDGTVSKLHSGGTVDIEFDVNGPGLPNDYGRDKFVFTSTKGKPDTNPIDFGPIGQTVTTIDHSRNNLKTWCSSTSNAQYRKYCTLLIMMDGWEIKDDYPWRI